ncbi:hypothetical protein GCM10011444_21030 [Winogradskyella haliclonae]|uniref:Uncharacterized protein n=2 Tax=Winogradskyella haliclonae TaxID=2048558 RepID=A0ABQ2C000_9FLAO|nr:hypothetical protein GCM10011444_21030 [Winogradskyella haliclonae]
MFDRGLLQKKYMPVDEVAEFYLQENVNKIQTAFEDNFDNPKYKFPRSEVHKIKVLKNVPFLSRLSTVTITDESKIDYIITFFNDPKNFDWGETTWALNESNYIFRFYNENDIKVGEIWLCSDHCSNIESIPFSPNMKFGGISEIGKDNMDLILNKIVRPL